MLESYAIHGYDKDGDVSEKLLSAENRDIAKTAGELLMRRQMETDAIRSSSGEPFDWFLLYENDIPVLRFTFGHPDGEPAS